MATRCCSEQMIMLPDAQLPTRAVRVNVATAAATLGGIAAPDGAALRVRVRLRRAGRTRAALPVRLVVYASESDHVMMDRTETIPAGAPLIALEFTLADAATLVRQHAWRRRYCVIISMHTAPPAGGSATVRCANPACLCNS